MDLRTLAIAFLVALPAALAGCLGGDDDGVAKASTRTPLKSSADVSGSLGGIQGVVTDEAIQPVPGAAVTIPDLGISVTAADDGSFAFSLLKPGLYTLVAAAEGYESGSKEVQVKAEAVASLDFILVRLAEQIPYADILEFAGFIECNVATPAVAVALCSIPQFIAENSTNDKFLFTFRAAPDPQTFVAEMSWTASQPLGTALLVVLEPEGLPNDSQTEYGFMEGKSPLSIRTDRARIEEADANMDKVCNGESQPESETFSAEAESYCRAPFAAKGGGLMTRVFVSGRTVDGYDGWVLGLSLQQVFTQRIGLFYHAPAPDGFLFGA